MHQFKIIFYSLVFGFLLNCNTSKKNNPNTVHIPVKAMEKLADSLLKDPLINSLSIGIYYKGQEVTKY